LAWVPKRSFQAQKDDNEGKGKKKIQKMIAKLEVCTESSKLLVMTSYIFSDYAYVMESIPQYISLSLNSLF